MPIIDRKRVLSGLKVQNAMRRAVIHLPEDGSIEKAIRYFIKYKANAILITDAEHRAVGVVSKTDVMGAYYAGLPIETPLGVVMIGPPLFCRPEDSLESALVTMRTNKIHRLYVLGDAAKQAVGVLAYPDIVGMLYRYCRKCNKSILNKKSTSGENLADRFTVREVMTPSVQAYGENQSLLEVMEGLSAHRFGAVLIKGADDLPAGVVSKTDLITAYKHGISSEAEARTIMSAPVRACDEEGLLIMAIKMMIFSDIHRLFVYREAPKNIVGVLTLSDIAWVRSGSCRACMISRIEIEM